MTISKESINSIRSSLSKNRSDWLQVDREIATLESHLARAKARKAQIELRTVALEKDFKDELVVKDEDSEKLIGGEEDGK